jgi:C_GCAxxG_C_C family probable redox protein
MNRKELAIERFRGDYNCAQSVLSVFGPEYGLSEKDAFRIAWPFGGGMGRLQKTCGAVTGAYMVIGLAWGMKKPETDEEKEKVYQIVREFTARFESHHGATDCLTLLGRDISTVEGRQKAKEDEIFSQRCEKYVGDAVAILEDLLKAEQTE